MIHFTTSLLESDLGSSKFLYLVEMKCFNQSVLQNIWILSQGVPWMTLVPVDLTFHRFFSINIMLLCDFLSSNVKLMGRGIGDMITNYSKDNQTSGWQCDRELFLNQVLRQSLSG